MKYLEDLKDDELLIVTPNGCDAEVMECEEFLQSSYYTDRDDVEVATAKPMYARFDLFDTLESLQDDMFEDWLERVTDDIPTDVRVRIEKEINCYLDKHPTYYPDEMVEW